MGSGRHPQHRAAGRCRAADVAVRLRDHRALAALRSPASGTSRTTSATTATSWPRRRSSTTPWAGCRTTTPCRRRSSSTSNGRRRCASRCCWSRSRSVTARRSTLRTSSPCRPTSGCRLYWLLLCGTLIYLLGLRLRALLVLRKDPRSRRIANIYLLASVSGIMACVIRIITAYVPRLQTARGRHPGVVLRLHVRRRLRARVGALVADQDEVVHPGVALTPGRGQVKLNSGMDHSRSKARMPDGTAPAHDRIG